jgi:hypothetical protein
MKVEFIRPDDEEKAVVATVVWDGREVAVSAADDAAATALVHAFRCTPVVVDDGAYRRLGTHGSVVIQPGDLEWFRAVALTRAAIETGLTPRLVAAVIDGGFDPAANYRSFDQQIERVDARGRG